MLLKAEGLYVFGPYRLAAHERQLLRNGAPVPLPPKAFDLLLAGESVVRVTRGGGFAPVESDDGKFIYYVKGLEVRGIWRTLVQGGEETPILDGPAPGFWGYWALLPHGVVFAMQDQNGRAHALVSYFNFISKQITDLGHLDSPAVRYNPDFAVSPDEKWIYYVKRKQGDTSDIMLVKNFR